MRVRAAQGDPPHHVVHPQVAGVGELAGDLERPVRAHRRVADRRRGRPATAGRACRATARHRPTALSSSVPGRRAYVDREPLLVDVHHRVSPDHGPPVAPAAAPAAAAAPSTSAATGSAMSAWATVSTRQSARSASLPGSSEPIPSSRPSSLRAADRGQLQRLAHGQRPGAADRRGRRAPRGAAPRRGRPPRWRRRRRRPGRPGPPRRAGRGSGRCRRRAGRWTTGSARPRCRSRPAPRWPRRRGGRRARTRRRGRASRGTRRTRPGSSRTVPGRSRPRRWSRPGACAAARPCRGPGRPPRSSGRR